MAKVKSESIPPSAGESPVETSVNPPPAEKVAPRRPDPTRYQDWEKNGRCIDF